jgi:integrase
MTKTIYKRKTRSDKFPLTLHKTGQYCKKIKGKIYYFGKDRALAMNRYYEQASYLHTQKSQKPKNTEHTLTIKTLCNMYLDHQDSRSAIGEIRLRHLCDQTSLLRYFVRFIGSNRTVSDISTVDLQNYRKRLIKAGKSPNTINNRIATVKAMYNWALNNEIIDASPRLNAIKKITQKKQERPTFTLMQIQELLQFASIQMKAMIWLGLNCGFGCTDCAELQWKNLDLENGRVDFPRGKTGVNRNLPLWPETVVAIKNVTGNGDLVFYTRRGNPWVRTINKVKEDSTGKFTKDNGISKEFSKLMKKVRIAAPEGVGFYTLRSNAEYLIMPSKAFLMTIVP